MLLMGLLHQGQIQCIFKTFQYFKTNIPSLWHGSPEIMLINKSLTESKRPTMTDFFITSCEAQTSKSNDNTNLKELYIWCTPTPMAHSKRAAGFSFAAQQFEHSQQFEQSQPFRSLEGIYFFVRFLLFPCRFEGLPRVRFGSDFRFFLISSPPSSILAMALLFTSVSKSLINFYAHDNWREQSKTVNTSKSYHL